MQKLSVLHLEPYQSRYTELLADWEKSAFSEMFEVNAVVPPLSPVPIRQGSVLDSIQRPKWAMQQVSMLLDQNSGGNLGKVYCSDFFHPGIESLPYSGLKGSIYSFCWAQTFDVYDFTRRMDFMRVWELMALGIYRHVFVACEELREMIMVAVPELPVNRVSAVGLPFNSKAVKAKWDAALVPPNQIDVVYTSRWDLEKNPQIFCELVELRPDLKFVVCIGREDIVGTDEFAISKILNLESKGRVKIYRNLTKAEYYSILSRCTIQINTSYQDWISFTLLEALTFGCEPLYPNWRSFPAALAYSEPNLYQPGSSHAAAQRLDFLLKRKRFPRTDDVLAWHDLTLNRVASYIHND